MSAICLLRKDRHRGVVEKSLNCQMVEEVVLFSVLKVSLCGCQGSMMVEVPS